MIGLCCNIEFHLHISFCFLSDFGLKKEDLSTLHELTGNTSDTKEVSTRPVNNKDTRMKCHDLE